MSFPFFSCFTLCVFYVSLQMFYYYHEEMRTKNKKGETRTSIWYRWRHKDKTTTTNEIFKRKRTYLWHFKCLCSMNHNEVIICRIDTDFIFWLHIESMWRHCRNWATNILCVWWCAYINKSLICVRLGYHPFVTYSFLLFCNLVYLGFRIFK